jgi:DNA polymerase-3 subunit gamma/tau
MSYLVLARKYRPQTFEEVYAQDHITQILSNTIELNRTAHAYLFTGPRGVGKTSMARIFAKSLNCLEGGPTPTPCNQCINCQEITSGTSADVIEIDGASNTGVDDIRGLQKELMYSASNSNYKIYIIDEVHMLSKNAFNALLKTLEEPPERVIFIFATTEPHKVLPTIISRCQRYDFKLIPIASIIKRLETICTLEGIKADHDALFIVAKKADGSMRDALSLMDQVLAYGKKHIKVDDVLAIFGIVNTEIYNEIFDAMNNQNPTIILTHLHNIIEKGNDLQEFISGLLEHARNILMLKLNVKTSEISNTFKDKMKIIAENFEEDRLLYLMSILIKMKRDIKNSSNPILIAEMNFIKLAKLDKMNSLEELIKELRKQPAQSIPNNRLSTKPVHPIKQPVQDRTFRQNFEAKTNSKPTTEISKLNITKLTKEVLNKEFKNLKSKMQKDKPFLAINLLKCNLESINNNFIHFQIDNNLAYQRLQKEKKYLSDLFSQHFGTKIKIDFELKEVTKNTIGRPTMEQIKKYAPDLADFIKITELDIV